MKTWMVVLGVVIVVGTSAVGCSTGSSQGHPSPGGSSAKAAPSPKEAVANAALVLDVRTKGEFDGGHLAQAENIPLDQVEARIEAIASKVGGDKTKPIALYCASGSRSGVAKQTLEKAGFTHLTNAGGYVDLKD
jgi:phage shock protein E